MRIDGWIKRWNGKFKGYVSVSGVLSLEELDTKIMNFRKGYIYRGQQEVWELKTSLEREGISQTGLLDTIIQDYGESELVRLEEIIKNKAYYFVKDYKKLSYLDKLTILQHHGCCTELLDFTTDPSIALFFAVQRKVTNKFASFWIVDEGWAREAERGYCKRILEINDPREVMNNYRKNIILNPAIRTKINGNSSMAILFHKAQLSRRMKRQKSIFLIPSARGERFMNNIIYPLRNEFRLTGIRPEPKIHMIIFPTKWRDAILKRLAKRKITEKVILSKENDFNHIRILLKEKITNSKRARNRVIKNTGKSS